MTDNLAALRTAPDETYKLVRVKVSSKLKERFERRAVPQKTKLLNEYEKQQRLQRAANTVPMIRRYSMLRGGREKLHKTEVHHMSYGKEWETRRKQLQIRQNEVTSALFKGNSSMEVPQTNSRGGIDKERFIEELGMTVGDRNKLAKKIFLAKNQTSKKPPSKYCESTPLDDNGMSKEELNAMKRANLPGNPFHDTFPTIFPVRTITMVTCCAKADSLAGFSYEDG